MSKLVLALTADALSTAVLGISPCVGPLLGDGPYSTSSNSWAAASGKGLRSSVTLTLSGPTTYTIAILVGYAQWSRSGDYGLDPAIPSLWNTGSPNWSALSWGSRGKVFITPSYDTGAGLAYTAGAGDPVVAGDGDATITVSETGLISACGQSWQIPTAKWDAYQITAIAWTGWRDWLWETHSHGPFTKSYGSDPHTRNSGGDADKHVVGGVTRSLSGSWLDGTESVTDPGAPANDVAMVLGAWSYTDTCIDGHNEFDNGECARSNDAVSTDPLYGIYTDHEAHEHPFSDWGFFPGITASKSLSQRLGDNIIRLASGTEYLVRTEGTQAKVYRRPGYDADWEVGIGIGTTGAFTRPPLGAVAADRYVVRQARTTAEVSEDLGTTFAAVDPGEVDPQVSALRAETELIALSADQPDGLMCGVRLTGGSLVAVDQDSDTATVASVSSGAQAVVLRGADGRWELVVLDAGTVRSYLSDGVGVQGWTLEATQALGAAADGLTRMVGWRTRAGVDLICGHMAADGAFRVWYRPGADQEWQGPELELAAPVAYPPYLYERPTGELEFGFYDGSVWTRRVADHPAGTWSAP